MSYPHTKPISIGDTFPFPADPAAAYDRSLPFVQSADSAIDSALRSVPLPEGLLARLKLLDEATDRMDYLGC
jgi:hypothetical protein